MPNPCIEEHAPHLRDRFNELVKGGMSEREAGRKAAMEDFAKLNNELNAFKKSIGIKLSKEQEAGYKEPDNSAKIKEITDTYNAKIEEAKEKYPKEETTTKVEQPTVSETEGKSDVVVDKASNVGGDVESKKVGNFTADISDAKNNIEDKVASIDANMKKYGVTNDASKSLMKRAIEKVDGISVNNVFDLAQKIAKNDNKPILIEHIAEAIQYEVGRTEAEKDAFNISLDDIKETILSQNKEYFPANKERMEEIGITEKSYIERKNKLKKIKHSYESLPDKSKTLVNQFVKRYYDTIVEDAKLSADEYLELIGGIVKGKEIEDVAENIQNAIRVVDDKEAIQLSKLPQVEKPLLNRDNTEEALKRFSSNELSEIPVFSKAKVEQMVADGLKKNKEVRLNTFFAELYDLPEKVKTVVLNKDNSVSFLDKNDKAVKGTLSKGEFIDLAFKIGNAQHKSAYEISRLYHEAKADGSNPELIKAVEYLIGKEQSLKETTKAETPTPKGNTSNVGGEKAETKTEPIKNEEAQVTQDTNQKEKTNIADEGTTEDGKEAGEPFVEGKRTILSHRGLQEVAIEFGFGDVTSRELKTDPQLFKDAQNKVDGWVEKGEYPQQITKLVEKAENAEVLTDEQRVILQQHIANVRGEMSNMDINAPGYDVKLSELNRLIRAGEATRSAAGAALRVPYMASVPNDLPTMLVEEMNISGVPELTPTQKATVQKEYSDISAAEKAYQQKIEALEAEKVLEISTTGAHASNNITTYGSYITNSHSGTGSINVAFNARAVNGDENIAAWFGRGKVRLGTTSFEKGILEILGNTSGTVTIQPAAAAGTWTMTLPTNDGDAGQYLQTNGSGVTSWATSSAGWGTTGTVATATGPMTLALAGNSFIWNDPTEGDLLSVNPSTFISTLQGSDGNYTSLISLNGNGTASNFNIFTSSGLNDVSIKGNPTTEQISLTAPQGIAFSASSSPTPDASSIVDIQSTTKGLLIPRMTETQRDAITSPATGLQIFQTDVSLGLKYYTGASWVPVGTGDFIALSGTSTLSGPTVINMGGNNIEISDASNTGVISFIPNVGQSEMVLDGSGKTFTATVANGYFFNTGNVQMNAYGAGAATFDASGNISSVSDEWLKDIQGNYGVGLNQLLKVNPIVYKWKPVSKMETAHSYIGFSAQNIRDVLGGNAVGVNKEGYLSIQDRAIMAAMVNSIKELKDLNDKQQNEINDLKKALQNK